MARARNSKSDTLFIKDPLWYKDAIIYQVHVKSYFDANNDGIGDFAGLIEKLDYIADLGVNTVWLLPFYPSPRRDDGYDIAEYRDVSRDYGSRRDAMRFIAEAHRRGLRVITELVINHTSDQHPWFQRARRAKRGSAARNFYVWSDSDEKFSGTRIIFVDTEKSNWTWDPVAKQYFWHRFYSHQPDLNFDNPRVLQEVLKVMRFWLDMGVDGLRLDAIPYLVERDGTNNENLPETHQVLKRIRHALDAHYPDRMLLAEANQWPEDTRPYFGGDAQGQGDECHMAFHFPLMPRMYMALAQEDRYPITDILRQTPDIPDNCQWAIFLRNHDELTLEMVTDRERDYLWNYYASDKRARINLGIRRRLAPLMEKDRRRIELLNSLLLSMPGTPVLYYGDEIGMGDNIYLGDRDGVRTPMQWSLDRNGGFSRADPARLVLPLIMDAQYGFQAVNVEAQQSDPNSLLNWTRRLLAIRKQQKAFGRGTFTALAPSNRRILAYLRSYTDADGHQETILCVANMSRAAQAVELDLSSFEGLVPVEMIGGSAFPPIGKLNYLMTLPRHGFFWFYLAAKTQMPSWHREAVEEMPELPTLVVKRDVKSLLEGPQRELIENELLPAYLPKRRWYIHRDESIQQVRLLYALPFGKGLRTSLLSEVEVHSDGRRAFYQLDLGFLPEQAYDTALPQQLALSRVRQRGLLGLLTDAFALDHFPRDIIQAMVDGLILPCDQGELRFSSNPDLARLDLAKDVSVVRLAMEQANSAVAVGDAVTVKLIRQVSAGRHPELEMSRYLTVAGYANMAPWYGDLVRIDNSGQEYVLMLAEGYLDNQGNGWDWTQNLLEKAIREEIEATTSKPLPEEQTWQEIDRFVGLFGRRLGEMHSLLAGAKEPDFRPEIVDAEAVQAWEQSIENTLDRALSLLQKQRSQLPQSLLQQVDSLQAHEADVRRKIHELAPYALGGTLLRVHGALHLGQVLVVRDDAYLTNFEGEQGRTLQERLSKYSPLKDVAGALRSFDYAAAMAQRLAQSSDASQETATIRRNVALAYQQRAGENFLREYRLAAAGVPQNWHYADGERAVLELCVLERAFYEIIYEVENRPAWLVVPLGDLAQLAGIGPQGESQ